MNPNAAKLLGLLTKYAQDSQSLSVEAKVVMLNQVIELTEWRSQMPTSVLDAFAESLANEAFTSDEQLLDALGCLGNDGWLN